MELNRFEVTITPGKEVELNGAYYHEIEHMTQYAVKLTNHWSVRAVAELWIDGKKIESFVVNPHRVTTIETDPNEPQGQRGKFTATNMVSQEAIMGGLDQLTTEEAGLIKVVFTPAKEEKETVSYRGLMRGVPSKSMGTTMTGTSDQKFKTVDEFPLDHKEATTFYIRLKEAGPNVRPLRGKNNNSTGYPYPV